MYEIDLIIKYMDEDYKDEFGSSDIEGTYQELHSHRVIFTEKPTAQPWGAMQAQFTDLDGNGFVLVSK